MPTGYVPPSGRATDAHGCRATGQFRKETNVHPTRTGRTSGGSEPYEYETEPFSDEEMQQIRDGAPPQSVVIQQARFFSVVL
mmetsp:Transcript_5458/g.11481  ORF Transcript_5458/g.11481 Transcript_5458/m.11481 type:complete len:82 (+) Transcript_5458:395-640(+)